MIEDTWKKPCRTFLWCNIIISGESGKTDIVTLKETADDIIRSYYGKQKKCDPELQKIHIDSCPIKKVIKKWCESL